MASDSDSDSGSYVSATPPRPSHSPTPIPPSLNSSVRVSSRTKPKQRPKPAPTKKSTRTVSPHSERRCKEKLRSSKAQGVAGLNNKPESESEAQSKPNLDPVRDGVFFSNQENISIRICKPESSSSSSNFTSSFARLVKLRRPSFDPALEFNADAPDPIQAENFAQNQVKSKQTKRLHPNLIRVEAPISGPFDQVKRPKLHNEGNFVRLNINGYGRKSCFRNGKRKYSASGGFRRKKWTGKKSNNGDKEVDLSGLDGIFEKQKAQPKLVKEVELAVEAVRKDLSEENLRNLLKLSHGFDLFREGQLEAIKNVVLGKSTMLILPTGAGKSLCYQLPALILPGVTLVVSPLLALMVDQLKKLPPVLPGGLLSSNQTSEESIETLNRLRCGEIKVLFVSPERFLNSEFLSVFEDNLTTSLVVIDEAHCISEWSHNFRPSYLRLKASLLTKKLNVKCILAMTATATSETLDSIMKSLEILPNNLIQKSQIRANLQLSISSSENRSKDLLVLLKSSPFVGMKSIIVYCKFQAETDMISKLLCDNYIKAKSYHSGLHAKERSLVQELFCSNKIRVVVATVAFGMGLDKSDVEGVIHYSLPESLEEYIQETGRAGRDGRLSHCHLFLDTTTYYKIRSLSYSDGVDEYALSRLLGQIFSDEVNLTGGIQSLLKEATARKLDIKEEVLFTVLTMLEIGDEQYLQLLPQLNVTCSLSFHKTSPHLLAEKDMLIRSILNLSEKKGGLYVFDIPNVANSLRLQASEVLDQLKNLKLSDEITYELKDQAYCFKLVKRPDDLFALSARLTKWLSQVEICKVQKLDIMYKVANFALKECKGDSSCSGFLHTSCIQEHIIEYFSNKQTTIGDECNNAMKQHSPFLHADMKSFLKNNSSVKLTPRALARIMHGIPSPAFPSSTWARNYLWGRYVEIDFQVVLEAAKIELMNFIKKSTEQS
ncbi:DEAD/DEAH box RNA helicase family protein isoform X1 [Carex rostrata]